jgi:ribosome assembly protein 4
MAALLPPPKRTKLYHGVPEPEPEVKAPVANVIVQFVSDEDGTPLAPAFSLSADLRRDGLELLANKFSKTVEFVAELA